MVKAGITKGCAQKAASWAKLTPENEALGMVQLTGAKDSWTRAWGKAERSR
ncbi:MAG: hypothetical protein GX463_00825 [Methanothrix sp.]|nr:hypothetical protein [Methanothrix sp.]